MAKDIYVGAPTNTYGSVVSINGSNLSTYFTVTNGSNTFTWDSQGENYISAAPSSGVATMTLVAKQAIKVHFYFFMDIADVSTFSINAKGVTVFEEEGQQGSEYDSPEYKGDLASGDTIILTYTDNDGDPNYYVSFYANIWPVTGTSSLARKVVQPYVGVEGIARKIGAGYVGVDGIARQTWGGGIPVTELNIGDSLYLNYYDASTEFIVIHKGNPNTSLYDASCDGVWLLMKDIKSSWVNRAWDTSDNDYANSDMHRTINNVSPFDSNVQAVIKEVKIPYWNGVGTDGAVASGSNGLTTKVFALSGYEVGWTVNTVYEMKNFLPIDGACLDYFKNTAATDSKRIAYYNGTTAREWWLRTPKTYDDIVAWSVNSKGSYLSTQVTLMMTAYRPALILDNNTKFDPETYTII